MRVSISYYFIFVSLSFTNEFTLFQKFTRQKKRDSKQKFPTSS